MIEVNRDILIARVQNVLSLLLLGVQAVITPSDSLLDEVSDRMFVFLRVMSPLPPVLDSLAVHISMVNVFLC